MDESGAAGGAGERGGSAPDAAERLARQLVRDVAAYEVDPPPPARAQPPAPGAPGGDTTGPEPAEHGPGRDVAE